MRTARELEGIGIYPTAFYCKDDAFQELAHQRMLEACKEK